MWVTQAGHFRIYSYAPSTGAAFNWLDSHPNANPTPSDFNASFMPDVKKEDKAKIACHGSQFPEDWAAGKYEAVIEPTGPRWVPKSEMIKKRLPLGGANPGGKRKRDENQFVLNGEEFRPVANLGKFDGAFCVSNFGRAKIDSVYTRGCEVTGGYLQFNFNGNSIEAHRAICATFRGPQPSPLHTVDHINQDRKDNHPSNLQWADHFEQNLNRSIARPRSEKEKAEHKASVDRMQAYHKKAFDDIKGEIGVATNISCRLKGKRTEYALIALFGKDPFETVLDIYNFDMIYIAHRGLTCLEFDDVEDSVWDRLGVNDALRGALQKVANIFPKQIDDMFMGPSTRYVRENLTLLLAASGSARDDESKTSATEAIDAGDKAPETISLVDCLTSSAVTDERAVLAFDYVCMLLVHSQPKIPTLTRD